MADSHNAVPGLSTEEVQKLFHVFDSEGERDFIATDDARPNRPCISLRADVIRNFQYSLPRLQ